MAAGKRVLCGSVVLNGEPSMLQQRLANSVYEACRAGGTAIPNFPDYGPIVGALRENQASDATVVFKVCKAKVDKLVVLSSLARRWTEYEPTQDEANKLISEHNKAFNEDGDFLEDDERRWGTN